MDYGKYGQCEATAKSTGERCERPACGEHGKCRIHGGKSTGPKDTDHLEGNDFAEGNSGNPDPSANPITHGLYQSEETFLKNAPQRHLDTYYAIHESLCRRFREAHGHEPKEHDKKELSHVAIEMVKIDQSLEYQADNAVDPEKPLTERQIQDIDGPMEVEAVSKVERLKTHIRRENRLTLKDKGIYETEDSPELGGTSLAEILRESDDD